MTLTPKKQLLSSLTSSSYLSIGDSQVLFLSKICTQDNRNEYMFKEAWANVNGLNFILLIPVLSQCIFVCSQDFSPKAEVLRWTWQFPLLCLQCLCLCTELLYRSQGALAQLEFIMAGKHHLLGFPGKQSKLLHQLGICSGAI